MTDDLSALDTLRPEVKDPNLLATSPTKWRAEHCVTHHHACDCREWEHATRVAELEDRAERAEAELAALKARIAGSDAGIVTQTTSHLGSDGADTTTVEAYPPRVFHHIAIGQCVRMLVED